jgi:hypothetical protein
LALELEAPGEAALEAPVTTPVPTAAPAETFAEFSKKLLLFILLIGKTTLLHLTQVANR